MQENTTIARPYAVAAFEQARQEGKLSAWAEMLNILSIVVSDAQMKSVLNNPRLDKTVLLNLIFDICGTHLSDTGKNFVKVLIDARRLLLAPQIYKLFEQKHSDAKGVIEVEVRSAYPLEPGEQDQIADAMGKRFGRKIEVSSLVDESLIGGIVIRTGDSVIDASVKGRLKQLANELAD